MKQPTPFPTVLLIETQSLCNANCVICANKNKDKNILPSTLIKKLIDECAYYGSVQEFFPFVHNEPLFEPRLEEILNYSINKMPSCNNTIYTNGQLLTRDKAKMLLDNRVNQITFSIDAVSPEIHKKMRPGLDFVTVKNNVLSFIEENDKRGHPCKTRATFCSTPINAHEADSFVNFWTGKTDSADWQPCDGRAAQIGREQAARDTSIEGACDTLFYRIFVLSNGDVPMCCIDWKPEMPIGNVYKDTLKEIWDSSKHNQIRLIHNEGRKRQLPVCNTCKARS